MCVAHALIIFMKIKMRLLVISRRRVMCVARSSWKCSLIAVSRAELCRADCDTTWRDEVIFLETVLAAHSGFQLPSTTP